MWLKICLFTFLLVLVHPSLGAPGNSAAQSAAAAKPDEDQQLHDEFIASHDGLLSWLNVFKKYTTTPSTTTAAVTESTTRSTATLEVTSTEPVSNPSSEQAQGQNGGRQGQSNFPYPGFPHQGFPQQGQVPFSPNPQWIGGVPNTGGAYAEDCSQEELQNMIGRDVENLPVMRSLPGYRCYTDDFFNPGKCVLSTCSQVRNCGARGDYIAGTCKIKSHMCCMPRN